MLPQFYGEFIAILWSRGVTESENRTAVEAESLKSLEEAVEAKVAAGFEILTRQRPKA